MNNINLITKDIIGASIEVHKTLGPGLLEKVYERALTYELQLRGHKVDTQVRTPIMYKGVDVSIGLEKPLKLDMLVDDEIIVELKSVEKLNEICTKQLLTYLKGSSPI